MGLVDVVFCSYGGGKRGVSYAGIIMDDCWSIAGQSGLDEWNLRLEDSNGIPLKSQFS